MEILSSTTVQKVLDNIYVFTDKDMEMNSTLIIGKKDCILVDTRQNISLAKESQSAIKSITHKLSQSLINRSSISSIPITMVTIHLAISCS